MHSVLRDLHLDLEAEALMGGKCSSGWHWKIGPGELAEELGLYSVGWGRSPKVWEWG